MDLRFAAFFAASAASLWFLSMSKAKRQRTFTDREADLNLLDLTPSCRRILQAAKKSTWPPIERAGFTLVQDVDCLERVAQRLWDCQAVGVDLEHSPRSYHGFVCTIQLSTRNEDFIIDCLVPEIRRNLHRCLGDVFASTKIFKVFHSASNDVKWLHLDFDIVVRAMIDTNLLAKDARRRGDLPAVLYSPSPGSHPMSPEPGPSSDNSLAALLRCLLSVKSDKRFQKADWSLRPLPPQMVDYARTDSRYLVSLAALLAPEDDENLRELLRKSHIIAQQRYDRKERETFSSQQHYEWVRNQRPAISRRAGHLFVLLCQLRHTAALQHDRNPEDVIEKKTLLCLANDGLDEDTLARIAVDWPKGLREEFAQARAHVSALADHELEFASASALGTDSPSTLSLSDSTTLDARELRKAARSQKLMVPRKTVLYNNIELLSPSGLLLARIDRRKALWYCLVGLVDILSNDGNVRAVAGLPEEPLADPVMGMAEGTTSTTRTNTATTGKLAGAPTTPLGKALAKKRQLTCDGEKNGTCIHNKPEHSGIATAGAPIASLNSSPELEALFDEHVRQLTTAGSEAKPLKLRMRREPRGKGHAGDEFHLREKANACAICGLSWGEAEAAPDGGLTRFYIIPHFLRHHFPLAAKSYSCHDVAISCTRCARAGSLCTASMMKALLLEFDLPSSPKEAHTRGLASLGEPAQGTPAAVGAKVSGEGEDTSRGPSVSALENALHQLVNMLKKDIGLVLRGHRGAISGKDAQSALERSLDNVGRRAFFVQGVVAALGGVDGTGAEPAEGLSSSSSFPYSLAVSIKTLESFMQFKLQGKGKKFVAELAEKLQASWETTSPSASVANPDAAAAADVVSSSLFLPNLRALLGELLLGGGATTLTQDYCSYDPAYFIVRSTLEGNERWRRAETFGRMSKLEGNMLPIPRLTDATPAVMEAKTWIRSQLPYSLPLGTTDDELSRLCASLVLPNELAEKVPGLSSGLPLAAEYRLTRLIQRWRSFFLDTVRPANLPQGWTPLYRAFQANLRTDGNKETALAVELLDRMWRGQSAVNEGKP